VTSDSSGTVVILGAGFSKAVYSGCPTTDELGEQVRNRLSPGDQARLPQAQFKDGRFEEWLSYLSEPQPHFTQDGAHEAAALVIRVTRVIDEVLSEIQQRALLAEPPPWFYEFLSVLHVTRPDVLTLNYDNLIECGIRTMRLKPRDWFGPQEIYEDDILAGLPPCADFPELVNQEAAIARSPGTSPYLASRRGETFKLLKLHGSLSWYWLPEGGGSSTLRRWQLPGTFGSLWDPAEEYRRQELPSHEVFLVPPAALKGQRLREPVARELWHRASQALSGAERVVLVGYSVPIADHSMSGMLTDAIVGRDVAVDVVDLDPCPVAGRLVRLGIPEHSITTFEAADCAQKWTSGEVDRCAASTASALRAGQGLNGEELVFVDVPRQERILRIEVGAGGAPMLRLVRNPSGQQLTRPMQYKDVRQALGTAGSCVVDVDGRDMPVIDYWVRPENSGAPMAQLHLVLAGL
jgi:hypothetical protein